MTMLSKLFWALYEKAGCIYLAPLLRHEENVRLVSSINERPVEYAFAMKCLARLCPASILDVGPGRSAWPHLMKSCGFEVTALDRVSGYWKLLFSNRHYRIQRDDITNPSTTHRFDAITCISVLEHIPQYNAAIKGMFNLLKPGGHLILTHPVGPRYVPNAYALPEATMGANFPFIAQVFSQEQLATWQADNNAELVTEAYFEAFSGDFWACGKRTLPPVSVDKTQRHHLGCFLFRKR